MTTIPRSMASEFIAAGHANNIPPAVLAGIASVESAFGANRGPSSAGAIGLMQFEPGTAAGLGIDPRNDRQAIWGAAKLLNQYGYQRDPARALSNYNAGPAATGQARAQGDAYARNVQGQALRLAPELGGSSSSPTSSAAPSSAGSTAAGGGASELGGAALRVALEFVLLAAGAALAYVGARRTLGPAPA